MLWPNFVGSSYTALSSAFALDQAVNVYPETRQTPGSAKQQFLLGTPGRILDATVATMRTRGWFTQDGQTWVTVGDTLYERTAPNTYVSRGTIADDGLPVSYASNGKGGNQLAICGGGQLYVLNLVTNALTAVVLPFMSPVQIVFIDGYGIINQANTPIQWFSALEDFTSWDALDFFTRSGTSDNTVGLAVTRDRVWVFGSKTSTQFYDSGDTDTPFLPYPGTTVQTGLVSPWLLTIYADTLFWIAESARGQRRAVMATDANVQPISTPPIDLFLNSATTTTNGRVLNYEQEGHTFIAWTLPSATANGDLKTPCYDVTESQRQQSPQWHFRANRDPVSGNYTQWTAAGATATGGTVLVGDAVTGDLYELDLDTYTDNGAVIRRERVAPYLGAENQWVFIDQVELGMQAGVGLSTGQGSDPQVTLDLSRDGGHSWVSAGFAALGATGEYLARAFWVQLGRARLDRLVFRVTQTDPVKTAWGPGLWLRVKQGTGQL